MSVTPRRPGGSTARVTLAQVAARAGVSVGAVSQVLNEHPSSRISTEARARIVAAVDELGYRPNLVARSLRTARTDTYGFVSDSVTITRHASGILRGALDAARTAGGFLLIAETAGDPRQEQEAVQSLLDRGVDGIVFAAMKSRGPMHPLLPPGLRTVNVNVADPRTASVLPDEFEGGGRAVRVLADAGHTEIALVGSGLADVGAEVSYTARRRLAGIGAATGSRGVAVVAELHCDDWQVEAGYEAVRDLLTRRRPTALLCLNDRLAVGAYHALAEAGLRVPADVSVVSFDDDEIAATLRPGLTTVAIPHEEMGRLAVEMMISGAELPSGDVLVPMALHERASVAHVR
ncbi:LacI family DNA-binding transcriptional regulator [Cellulomonas sp. Sa3CUA2]|uniref:LacI family DNA-binding transcriptional regulator n=1 Tax=Cellulomonas avistercoris TaxID=2762242 RepID=A0ABR8QIU3_9CELL|nr:LacI family DNA-binding transcriptional regulator [Cellulomonas avistercoris]MBD7920320.1 LacI family DNA-binding transcriptional regulator [Cellulomonas avistercoris]